MYARRSRFGDAARAARNDDAADAGKLAGGGVYWKNVTLNAHFPHPTREEMTILTAGVEDCDTLHE